MNRSGKGAEPREAHIDSLVAGINAARQRAAEAKAAKRGRSPQAAPPPIVLKPEDVEPGVMLIDGDELARLISMSPKWVRENRRRIIGAMKVGGRWRFDIEKIRSLKDMGKNFVIEKRRP